MLKKDGGARVDCLVRTSAKSAAECHGVTRELTTGVPTGAVGVFGSAQCAVVTAWPHPCRQQQVLRNSGCCEFETAELWQ